MASGNWDSNHERKPLMPMRIVDEGVDGFDEGVVVKRVFKTGEANGTLLLWIATVDLNLLWEEKVVLENASALW
jgi:hypothetical protein